MPQIIFTSRYIKGGAAHRSHFVKYTATRENSVPLQRRAELDNYVDYVATRPGAVRAESGHGLWNGGDTPPVLAQVQREVANHPGNVWTHVVSLRREDAERLGYNTPEMWRMLVLSRLPVISAAMNIPQENLRWYAAYHDREENPHIHLIVFSENPRQGYLTEQGIERMRATFAHEIYREELVQLYERKDILRTEVKELASEWLRELTAALPEDNPEVAVLLHTLGGALQSAKGKKQYAYLRAEHKALADKIVTRLAAEPAIAELYRCWCELTADVKRMYTDNVPDAPPLAEETTFRSIKNEVIRQALLVYEAEQSESEVVLAPTPPSAPTAKLYSPDVEPLDENNPLDYVFDGSMPGEDAPQPVQEQSAHAPAVGTLLRHLAGMIRQDYDQKGRRYAREVESRLMQKINRKKLDLGQKLE